MTIAFLRVLLFLLCAETSWRFALWWRLIYRDDDTRRMRPLMLGIAISQAGFAFFAAYGILSATHIPRGPFVLTVFLIGDTLLALGTILHLTTAWRMRERWSIFRNIGIRVVAAIIIAALLMVFDHTPLP